MHSYTEAQELAQDAEVRLREALRLLGRASELQARSIVTPSPQQLAGFRDTVQGVVTGLAVFNGNVDRDTDVPSPVDRSSAPQGPRECAGAAG